MNTETSRKVDNMDAVLELLENEQERPRHNSFLDLQEPEIMDEFNYRRIQKQSKKYGYAVKN